MKKLFSQKGIDMSFWLSKMSFKGYNLWLQPGCICVKATTGFYALGETTGAQCPFSENTHHDCVLSKSHPRIRSRSGSISHFLCINQRCPSGSATLSSGSRDLLQQSGVPEEPIRGSVMDSQRCLYTWLKSLLCGGLLGDFIWHLWKTSGPTEPKKKVLNL